MTIGKRELSGMLRELERIAEHALQHDSAFLEAFQALKWEIERDRNVRATVQELQAAGHRVFSSFVPRIHVQARTTEGAVVASSHAQAPLHVSAQADTVLVEELKRAASAAIPKSRRRTDLERVVNEATASNIAFENIASQLEHAGYEVQLSLEIAPYARIQGQADTSIRRTPSARPNVAEDSPDIEFSSYDHSFLKALKISPGENLAG